MQSPAKHDLQTAATEADGALAMDTELSILRGVFKMLPAGVTVQDEQGRFLLVNDVAAEQLGIAIDGPAAPDSKELTHRRETGLELLRTGRPAVAEEWVTGGEVKQLLLTAHRPVRIGDRDLLLSSSADITARKALEDQLFRAAYHDELTGLPARRVIEHRADNLLQHDEPHARFALAFLDIDNFKHINDYYGHAIGDALLVEVAKRVGLDLRESDMLSRISGDEFLLLLNPIQSNMKSRSASTRTQRLKAPFFIDGSEIFASPRSGWLTPNMAAATVAPERRYRDVSRKNDGKGGGLFRRQHGARRRHG
jgi:diguanylate cyclase (GGDEF)-like protein